jgi:hypothetical protein
VTQTGLKIGSSFPELSVFDAAGKPFNMRSLKGQYTSQLLRVQANAHAEGWWQASGGHGRFMTRFHRQPDGSLKVIRGPGVGDRAPDFTLNRMKGGGKVQLASLRGKPAVLIFGSYT